MPGQYTRAWRPALRRRPRAVCVPGHPRPFRRLQGAWMAGIPLHAEAVSGANIHTGVIGEAQSCRSIESKGIVRALEVYCGPAELLGDDNIIQRITTDR